MKTSPDQRRSKGSDSENAALDSDLAKLFEHQLQDTYYAENAITKALPKMIKAAHSEELKDAFEKHLTQTEGRVARLESVFKLIGRKPRARPAKRSKALSARATK
jgi:ferritin-like metal-binding protein YciE